MLGSLFLDIEATYHELSKTNFYQYVECGIGWDGPTRTIQNGPQSIYFLNIKRKVSVGSCHVEMFREFTRNVVGCERYDVVLCHLKLHT